MLIPWRRSRGQPDARLFTTAEVRLAMECAFQAGRKLGWRAADQLATAARRYRTYLILAELQALELDLDRAGAKSEAAGVALAFRSISKAFSSLTPDEAALLRTDGPLAAARPRPRPRLPSR